MAKGYSVDVQLMDDDETIFTSNKTFDITPGDQTSIDFSETISKVKKWSAEIPNLYDALNQLERFRRPNC